VLQAGAVQTPAEAAELLGPSRPLVSASSMTGSSHRIASLGSRHLCVRLDDVLHFATQREQRREARRRIAEVVDDAGLPY
jgi:hypothetical protein